MTRPRPDGDPLTASPMTAMAAMTAMPAPVPAMAVPPMPVHVVMPRRTLLPPMLLQRLDRWSAVVLHVKPVSEQLLLAAASPA